MKTYKEFMKESGDWWHPDPKKDRNLPGRGPILRAREDSQKSAKKIDYSNRLKPGETYMQFSQRKQSERSRK